MGEVNVLGFTSCTLRRCDCGAQITLGVTHAMAGQIVALLAREGIELRPGPDPHGVDAADRLREYAGGAGLKEN